MKFPERFRWKDCVHGYSTKEGDPFGVFCIPGRETGGRELKVIAADGEETKWEHVSVSLPDSPKRCPSWDEMCIVKNLFWDESECVVQFHPPKSDYVNFHAGVLHLWRFVEPFPMPPKICV